MTKQNFRSRHLHANLDPNSKNKDGKELEKKIKKSKGEFQIKEKTDGKTRKLISDDEKTKIKSSNESLKNVALGDVEKDSIGSLAALPVDNTVERPSKIPKLSNSHAEAVS